MTGLPRERPARPAPAVLIALAFTLLGAGLPGCGQKGALYLPGESPQRVEPGLPADPAEPDRADEDEDEEGAAGEG